MRKINILVFGLILTSCYNIDFREGEYSRFVEIRILSENKCSIENVDKLKKLSTFQLEYANHMYLRNEIKIISNELNSIISTLDTKDDVSCKIKLNIVKYNTNKILDVLGEQL